MKKNRSSSWIERSVENRTIRQHSYKEYRVGVRNQDVAIAIGKWLITRLSNAFPGALFNIVPIKCTADRFSLSPLTSFTGPEIFSDELEQALKNGEVDFVVQPLHECLNSNESDIITAALTSREDARDLLVMKRGMSINDLKRGDRIGYYSKRQQVFFSQIVKGMQYRPTSGSVLPRLQKLENNEVNALLISAVDVIRLNPTQYDFVYQPISVELMCPPPGRGITAIRVMKHERELANRLKDALDDTSSRSCFVVEKMVQEALGEPFNEPVGIYCEEAENVLMLRSINAMGQDRRYQLNKYPVSRPFSPVPDASRLLMFVQQLMGKVGLIGVGPGPRSLLTIKATKWLQEADLIVYDDILCENVILEVVPTAEKVFTGERRDLLADGKRIDTVALLLKAIREGKNVARLFYGDPMINNRGFEEAEALSAVGARFELVPGVTPTQTSYNYIGLAVGSQEKSDRPTFYINNKDQLNEKACEAMVRADGNWVISNAIPHLPDIIVALKKAGMIGDTPCTIVTDPGTSSQKLVHGIVSKIDQLAAPLEMSGHSLLLIGPAFVSRNCLEWWPPKGAMSGKRVTFILSRSVESVNKRLGDGVDAMGGTSKIIKLIQTETGPEIAERMDQLLGDLLRDHVSNSRSALWFVFTGVNSVKAFIDSLHRLTVDFRTLNGIRFAALNKTVADELANKGLRADFIPKKPTNESLGEELISQLGSRDRVAVLRGVRRTTSISILLQMANIEYIDLPAYETKSTLNDRQIIQRLLKDTDVLAFSNAATAQFFVKTINDHGFTIDDLKKQDVVIIAQGRQTVQLLTSLGVEIGSYTYDNSPVGLLNCLAAYRDKDGDAVSDGAESVMSGLGGLSGLESLNELGDQIRREAVTVERVRVGDDRDAGRDSSDSKNGDDRRGVDGNDRLTGGPAGRGVAGIDPETNLGYEEETEESSDEEYAELSGDDDEVGVTSEAGEASEVGVTSGASTASGVSEASTASEAGEAGVTSRTGEDSAIAKAGSAGPSGETGEDAATADDLSMAADTSELTDQQGSSHVTKEGDEKREQGTNVPSPVSNQKYKIRSVLPFRRD